MKPVVDSDLTMAARDGVVLTADVYRPAEDGRWPTLLHRTPYDRHDPAFVSALVADPLWLARQGFAVVVGDVRGRFGSAGEFDFAVQERDDGYDAVEWAAAQPWSDGNVGVYGSSYHAISAYEAVASRPPHLRAAVAMVGAADAGAASRPGGIFESAFFTAYALTQCLNTIDRMTVSESERAALRAAVHAAFGDPLGTVGTLPLTAVPGLEHEAVAPFWHHWVTTEPNTATDAPPPLTSRPDIEIPLLQVAGYRDFLAPTMFDLARGMDFSAGHRFIAGPWAHCGVYDGHVGSRSFPNAPGGVATWGPVIAAWFDRHLRGGDGTGHPTAAALLDTEEPVVWFVGGEDRWSTAAGWPPPARATEFVLGSVEGARSSHGDGTLSREPRAGASADSWQADPRDPFPTCGGAMLMPLLGPDGIQDQRAVDGRVDVLVFSTEPLTEPLTVAGRAVLDLAFSSDAPDADLCVTLVDVEPGGYAVPVVEGAIRTRYRDGGTDSWLRPGVIERIRVALDDTGHTFRAGHRLRVQIAGASWPRRSRNLHTRSVPEAGDLDEAVVAEHRVHHDPDAPSRLTLHVVG